MASTKQIGLRLNEEDEATLGRIAEKQGRTEQEVLRDSLRMYAADFEDQLSFLQSVERGWFELRSGLGSIVSSDDGFYDDLRKEIKNETSSS